MKRILAALAIVILAGPAYAGTGTLTLTTNVTAVCKFDVAAMTDVLPNYDATTGITNHLIPIAYTCSPGVAAPTMTIGAGTNDAGAVHNLSNGTDVIPYVATAPTPLAAPTGASQSADIDIDVAAGTFVPAGVYTDTLALTIQF